MSQLSTPAKASKRSDSPSSHRKPCDLCHELRDVLVRCRIDETLDWRFVCTTNCWKLVSGGEIDGPEKPFYTYGGIWKNKAAGSSGKKPKSKKNIAVREWSDSGVKYTTNDRVKHAEELWVCRRSHQSSESTAPGLGYTYWKEHDKAAHNSKTGTA